MTSIDAVMRYIAERPGAWCTAAALIETGLSVSTARRALNELWAEGAVQRRQPPRKVGAAGAICYEYQYVGPRRTRQKSERAPLAAVVWTPELARWLGVPAAIEAHAAHATTHIGAEAIRRSTVGRVTVIEFGRAWQSGDGITPPRPASNGFTHYEALE